MTKLLLLGHGSSKHPDSSQSVRMHANLLRESGKFSEVRCAFLKEEPLVENSLEGWENELVVIVPDFLAEGYFTRQVIPAKLGLQTLPKLTRYSPPVGTHPMMSELMADASDKLLGAWLPGETSLLVVGHGSGKNRCSKQTLLTHLHHLRDGSDYAQIADLWLEEQPQVSAWKEIATRRQVIILPFLLNDGQHGGWDIPVELGIPANELVHGRTYYLDDKEVKIAPALGTSSRFAEAISALAEMWGQ